MIKLEALKDLYFEPILDANSSSQIEILRIRNSDSVRNNMFRSHIISVEEHLEWLNTFRDTNQKVFFVTFYMGKVIGGVSLYNICTENRRADWAFYLDPVASGKGLGSAIEFKVLDHVFLGEQLQKLDCEVIEFNVRVINIHRRFGFIDEGFRRNRVMRNGKWWGAKLLGLTKDEWLIKRAEIE